MLVLPVALLSNKLEHEPLKRGQRWNPCSTMWEQNTVMIIAHYLIIQELTAPEVEQLIKWLSAFKMATKKRGIFILLALVPILPAKSCVPSEVDEAIGDGQSSPHPDAPNATGGCWGGELTFKRVGLLLKSKSTFELQLKIEEDSLAQCTREGSQCWPADQYGSPFAFKDLLIQNFRENVFGALGPLVCI